MKFPASSSRSVSIAAASAIAVLLPFLAACETTRALIPAAPTRTNLVTMKGNPVTLEGAGVRVGQSAPECVVVANDLSERRLSEYVGRTVILSVVPSLDTAVCDEETRTFNERAASLSPGTVVLTVSMDLPFAQKRWCGTHGIERVLTLSDYKHRDVGTKFGLRMRENGLLARAVYVIDSKGVIRYEQIVKEIATEPDYDAVLAVANDVAQHAVK
jgi:thioredoxin-dependent peroxiredoxin